MREPRQRRRRGSDAVLPGARADRRPRSRPSPTSRRRCSSRSTPPSAPSPTSPGRSSRRRSPRAPPTLDVATRDAAAPAAVPRSTPRRCSPTSSPGSRRCGSTRPTIASALEIGAPVLRARRSSTASCPRPPQALRGLLRTTPGVNDGIDRLDETAEHPHARRCSSSPRRRRSATTPRSLLRNLDEPHRPGDAVGHLPALQRLRAARSGPTTRAARPTAPANGGRRRQQPPALQPVPEHRRAGPDADRVRGGQRGLPDRASR